MSVNLAISNMPDYRVCFPYIYAPLATYSGWGCMQLHAASVLQGFFALYTILSNGASYLLLFFSTAKVYNTI